MKTSTAARSRTKIADLMTTDLRIVPSDMPVSALAEFLIEHEISGALVEDEAGDLVGVVSLYDLAGVAVERAAPGWNYALPDYWVREWNESLDGPAQGGFHLEDVSRDVNDIMNRAIYSVPVTASLSEVARMMQSAHIRRVLVTDDNAPVGIITASDLLRVLADEEE